MKGVNCQLSLQNSALSQQNHYTLKNKPVIFQSKLNVSWTLLSARLTGVATVPRARRLKCSLIIPSAEILVDHYFLSTFEQILMAIEIIIHYKTLLHLEGIL